MLELSFASGIELTDSKHVFQYESITLGSSASMPPFLASLTSESLYDIDAQILNMDMIDIGD